MKIYLDNIIFSKSKNGGISNYWYELVQYLENKTDNNVFYFESPIGKENFHRKSLSLLENQIIEIKSNGLNKVLPIS